MCVTSYNLEQRWLNQSCRNERPIGIISDIVRTAMPFIYFKTTVRYEDILIFNSPDIKRTVLHGPLTVDSERMIDFLENNFIKLKQ
jgi:hypothetical protein